MSPKPYKDTDFIAFVSLLNDLAADFDGQATDEAAQLEYESFIGRDLTKQRVVIRHPEDPSQLIAYADFFVPHDSAEANLALGVRAHVRGREPSLYDWLASQVKSLNVNTLNMYAPGKARGLRAFLETQGFEEAGAYRMLVLEPFNKPESSALPDGYTLTTYANTPDDALFISASDLSFSDLWGHTPATKEAWEMLLEFYEPENLYLLLYEGSPAGIFKLRVSDNEGFIDSPGLAPGHRSADLYRALTLAGLDHLAPHTIERVWLETWGEPEETVNVYKGLGFKVDTLEIGYKHTLD